MPLGYWFAMSRNISVSSRCFIAWPVAESVQVFSSFGQPCASTLTSPPSPHLPLWPVVVSTAVAVNGADCLKASVNAQAEL